jgi:energy-coupling factor transport system ATP-binding protein
VPIELKNVHYTWAAGTPWARPVLKGVNLKAPPGECLGLLGSVGSGKTTLVQHLNGLLLPLEGEVRVGDRRLSPGTRLDRLLYREVGVVFQFPEKQLFGETIFEDVAMGLRFAGSAKGDIEAKAAAALERVGLDPERDGRREIVTLSWGEKRMVALAGVLAMNTPRLVLDEPGAGLDPAGRERLLDLIRELVREEGRTVVFVSHHLDDLFRVADRLAVLAGGRIIFSGEPADLCRREDIGEWGLEWPPLVQLMHTVAKCRPDVPTAVRTPEEAAAALLPVIDERRLKDS